MTAGAGEGVLLVEGVVPPGRRVAGHCCGGRAAGAFGGGAVLRSADAALDVARNAALQRRD